MDSGTTQKQRTLEQRLWDAADSLRGNQEPGEYKHVVLGLVFLKYLSDRHTSSIADADGTSATEQADDVTSDSKLVVPPDAEWSVLDAWATQPEIGEVIDNAMRLIEEANPHIQGMLPGNYARTTLDKTRLGRLVRLIGSIGFTVSDDHGSDDVLGRVYEYFLGQFAGKETGKDAGAYYTPRGIVRLLVEMLEPDAGVVYDPASGSGGMFVQTSEFVRTHGGDDRAVAVYGQEFTDSTWRLARMNLALRGIEAHMGDRASDSFTDDQHEGLLADYILANPPFNVSSWWSESLRMDQRWRYGVPPAGNANFAWIQHIIAHLAPSGTAGLLLANGSLSSKSGGEDDIRRRLVEEGLVDCIVALPDRLFLNTGIPVCLWILAKNRNDGPFRTRQNEVLFIDARDAGRMVTRRLRELSDSHISQIAEAYHLWRGANNDYHNIPGFCYSADIAEITTHEFVLTPGRYVGLDDDHTPDGNHFEEAARLRTELLLEFQHGQELELQVREMLDRLSQ